MARRSFTATGFVLLLLVLIAANLQAGAFDVPIPSMPGLLLMDNGSDAAFALREIRLPRIVTAALVGAALGLSGLLIQIVTRNPLGDPGLTGVSGGAALGVAISITMISTSAFVVLPMGIAGGALAASLAFLLARGAGFEGLHLILAGLAVSLFSVGATGAVMFVHESSMQTLYFWMIGGFSGRGWVEVTMLTPFVFLAGAITFVLTPILSVLRLDDPVANGVGLSTGRWRLAFAALSVLLAASSVAAAGPIAFVGFLAPHIVLGAFADRMGREVAVTVLVPMSALTGAVLTLAADLAARALPFWSDAPAGIWVTLFGGITFLFMAPRVSEEVPR